MSLKGFLHYDFKRYLIYLYWYVRSEPSTCEKLWYILLVEGKKKGKGKKKHVIDNSYLASHYYVAMVTGLGFLNSAVNKNVKWSFSVSFSFECRHLCSFFKYTIWKEILRHINFQFIPVGLKIKFSNIHVYSMPYLHLQMCLNTCIWTI